MRSPWIQNAGAEPGHRGIGDEMGKTFRTAGWLAVMALLGAALITPTVAFADTVTPISEGNRTGRGAARPSLAQ